MDKQSITDVAVASFDKCQDPRLKEILISLVRHLHDFARDVHLTADEWRQGLNVLVEAGRISHGPRNEFEGFSDLLGLSSLIDLMGDSQEHGASVSTVLGPFFIDGLPLQKTSDVDLRGDLPGDPTLFSGLVVDADGRPIAGAEVDLWHTRADARYDVMVPELKGQTQFRCKLPSGPDGRFNIKTILPQEYRAPEDGPAPAMLEATGRSPWRPAHYHFRIKAPGYRLHVAQIYPEGSAHLEDDSVFGVRDSLILKVKRSDSAEEARALGMPNPFFKTSYTFSLAAE